MYIQFNKDINRIKNTATMGLSWREIAILTVGSIIALILFFNLRNSLGVDMASYIMVPVIMLTGVPIFYHKRGVNMTFEKLMYYKLKRILISSKNKIRHYESENVYALIESQIEAEEKARNVKSRSVKSKNQNKRNTEFKKHAAQNSAADNSVSGYAKRRHMHGKT